MSLAMLIFLQATTALGIPTASFDIRLAGPAKPCASGGDEIVVCGRRTEDEAFRLRPLPTDRFVEKPLSASIGLGKGTLGIEGEEAAMPQGQVSKRAMLKFKMPF